MQGNRTERLGRLMQEKISAMIIEGRIKDPRVTSFVTITRVNVSRDLSFADVLVSNIQETADLQQNADGLQSAAGFIRSQLCSVLHLRKIPHLRFHTDNSIRQGFDMIQKIEKLVNEDTPSKP